MLTSTLAEGVRFERRLFHSAFGQDQEGWRPSRKSANRHSRTVERIADTAATSMGQAAIIPARWCSSVGEQLIRNQWVGVRFLSPAPSAIPCSIAKTTYGSSFLFPSPSVTPTVSARRSSNMHFLYFEIRGIPKPNKEVMNSPRRICYAPA